MKLGLRAFTMIACLALTTPVLVGCVDTMHGAAGVAGSFTTGSAEQVKTYSDATRVATLATKTVDLAVQTGKLNRATLLKITQLNETVHTAWLELKRANDAGQSLNFATFNAALSAFETYRQQEAIPQATS